MSGTASRIQATRLHPGRCGNAFRVPRGPRAAEINIGIMRVFARLREMLATNKGLARKVAQHDQGIGILFEHVQLPLEPPESKRQQPIGFIHPKDEEQ